MIPPEAFLGEFEQAVEPIRAWVRRGPQSENHTLASIRDTLLPRLISGQIRVPTDAFEDAGGRLMTSGEDAYAEQPTLQWLGELGWEVEHGPDLGPDGSAPERDRWRDVVLIERLRSAVAGLNPELPDDAVEYVVQQVLTSLVSQRGRRPRRLSPAADRSRRRVVCRRGGDRARPRGQSWSTSSSPSATSSSRSTSSRSIRAEEPPARHAAVRQRACRSARSS